MKPIESRDPIQKEINRFANKVVYLHLETTTGSYTSHYDEKALQVGAYIRNGKIQFFHGKITGDEPGPYRVGLKMDLGWVYAEGLTHWEVDDHGRLLMAGHDGEGKLAVAFQLSEKPF